MPLPAWSAAMAQVPAARMVTEVPLTEQAVEVVLNVTARPELAPALMVNGAAP